MKVSLNVFERLGIMAILPREGSFLTIKIVKKYFADFNDTAKHIKNFDLIITVDTALAHLAASMKIRTYIIISSQSGFLWMKENNNNIWYKNIVLFRERNGDWKTVFKNINDQLKKDFDEKKETL